MLLHKALEDCSPEIREAAMLLFKGAASTEEADAILTLVMEGRRRTQRARYEYGGSFEDAARRTMPARIPAGLARMYEDCAKRRGLSTYAWVREALHRQWKRDTDPKRVAKAAKRDRAQKRAAAIRLQNLLDKGVLPSER